MKHLFVALALLFAGCAAPAPDSAPEPEPVAPEQADAPQTPTPALPESPLQARSEVPWGLHYRCGPGHEAMGSAGCYGEVADASRTMGEPRVALHPTDPRTFVIAVSDTRRPDAMTSGAEAIDVRGITVYITRDEGDTFTSHVIDLRAVGDLPANPSLFGADPEIVFAPDGTLHLTGLLFVRTGIPSPTQFETVLFATSTSDLGGTWSDPVVLDTGGYNDRQWMSTHGDDVWVSWRQLERGVSKAQRLGGPVVELEGCRQVSEVRHVAQAMVACRAGAGDLRLQSLDGEEVASVPGGCPGSTARLTAHGETLLGICYDGTFSISLDAGQNWTTPRSVFAMTSLDDAWVGQGPFVFDVETDHRGHIHVMVAPFPTTDHQFPVSAGRPVAHLVIDPAAQTLAHEALLQGPEGAGHTWFGFADDYYGSDFAAGRGVLVWTSASWDLRFAVLDIA